MLKKAEFETKYHKLYARMFRELGVGFGEMEKRMEEVVREGGNVEEGRERKEFYNGVAFFGRMFMEGVVSRRVLDSTVHHYLHKYFSSPCQNLPHL